MANMSNFLFIFSVSKPRRNNNMFLFSINVPLSWLSGARARLIVCGFVAWSFDFAFHWNAFLAFSPYQPLASRRPERRAVFSSPVSRAPHCACTFQIRSVERKERNAIEAPGSRAPRAPAADRQAWRQMKCIFYTFVICRRASGIAMG